MTRLKNIAWGIGIIVLLLSCNKNDDDFKGQNIVGQWVVKSIARAGQEGGPYHALDSGLCNYTFRHDGLAIYTCNNSGVEHQRTWYYQEEVPQVVLVEGELPFNSYRRYDVLEYEQDNMIWERIISRTGPDTAAYLNLRTLHFDRVE